MSEKIICYCKNVTEKTIVDAVRLGATSIDTVRITGACTGNRCHELNPKGCCCCADILEIIKREICSQNSDSHSHPDGANTEKHVAEPIKITQETHADNEIPEETWKQSLLYIQPDSVAGIRHAPLSGNPTRRVHVAEIPQRVTAHYHTNGEETYRVVLGGGVLHYGPVTMVKNRQKVDWQVPLLVKKSDAFAIPENYAHQLERTGKDSLIIIFACSDEHLAADRYITPDSPYLTSKPDN